MSSTPTNQPSAGPTVKLHQAPDASSSEESQYMRLDLDKTTVEALKKAGQAGANVEISFGKSPALSIDQQRTPLNLIPTETTNHIYETTSGGNLQSKGTISHSLLMEFAKKQLASVDVALDKLHVQVERNNVKRNSTPSSSPQPVKRKAAHSVSALRPNSRPDGSLGPVRSRPASPAMNASATKPPPSNRLAPTSTPSAPSSSNKKRQMLSAAKKPFIHLLAVGPTSRSSLAQKVVLPESDARDLLSRFGKASRNEGLFELSDRSYRELDIWAFKYPSTKDRDAVQDNARRAFDRMRVPASEANVWDKLLAPEDRGKGIRLSKLKLGGPQSGLGISMKPQVQSDHRKMLAGAGGEVAPRTKTKDSNLNRVMNGKKPLNRAPKPQPAANGSRSPHPEKRNGQITTNNVSSKKARTKEYKSAEFIDGDEEAEMNQEIASPEATGSSLVLNGSPAKGEEKNCTPKKEVASSQATNSPLVVNGTSAKAGEKNPTLKKDTTSSQATSNLPAANVTPLEAEGKNDTPKKRKAVDEVNGNRISKMPKESSGNESKRTKPANGIQKPATPPITSAKRTSTQEHSRPPPKTLKNVLSPAANASPILSGKESSDLKKSTDQTTKTAGKDRAPNLSCPSNTYAKPSTPKPPTSRPSSPEPPVSPSMPPTTRSAPPPSNPPKPHTPDTTTPFLNEYHRLQPAYLAAFRKTIHYRLTLQNLPQDLHPDTEIANAADAASAEAGHLAGSIKSAIRHMSPKELSTLGYTTELLASVTKQDAEYDAGRGWDPWILLPEGYQGVVDEVHGWRVFAGEKAKQLRGEYENGRRELDSGELRGKPVARRALKGVLRERLRFVREVEGLLGGSGERVRRDGWRDEGMGKE